MPGPPPKPTALKILEGNPGKKALNKKEPKPAGAASCPEWLHKDAKVEWRRLSAELERLGLLTSVDRAAFAGYCQAYARWKAAEQVLDRQGMTMTALSGYVQARPEVAIAHREMDLMLKYAIQLGFTPSARSRISVSDKSTGDEFESFLNTKRQA